MPQWTTGQSNAINAKNKNILVSAAAGSGKTAVLVERVIIQMTVFINDSFLCCRMQKYQR